MVGGGVLGSALETRKKEYRYVTRSNEEMFKGSPGVQWDQRAVAEFDPDNDKLKLADGEEFTYDYLVVAPGCELRYDLIEGASAALEDPECPAGSIY
jgi:NADH dehydrogenase FAD-containing subunit